MIGPKKPIKNPAPPIIKAQQIIDANKPFFEGLLVADKINQPDSAADIRETTILMNSFSPIGIKENGTQ